MIRHPETIYTRTRQWVLYLLPECRTHIPQAHAEVIAETLADDRPHAESVFN